MSGLPPIVEWLATRWENGRILCNTNVVQVQTARIAAATATAQSLSSIATSPGASEFAMVVWQITFDPRMKADALDLIISQYGQRALTAFLDNAIIENGLQTWLVITGDSPLRWDVENLSRFDQWMIFQLHYLSVAQLTQLTRLRQLVDQYGQTGASATPVAVHVASAGAKPPSTGVTLPMPVAPTRFLPGGRR